MLNYVIGFRGVFLDLVHQKGILLERVHGRTAERGWRVIGFCEYLLESKPGMRVRIFKGYRQFYSCKSVDGCAIRLIVQGVVLLASQMRSNYNIGVLMQLLI